MIPDFITRQYVRENPDKIFVFGDNLEERGFGGQAREFRGEFNSVGIPTKRSPSMSESSFFSDKDFDELKPILDEKFFIIEVWKRTGLTVVVPKNGIGTGLAELDKGAPRIFSYIKSNLDGIQKEMNP